MPEATGQLSSLMRAKIYIPGWPRAPGNLIPRSNRHSTKAPVTKARTSKVTSNLLRAFRRPIESRDLDPSYMSLIPKNACQTSHQATNLVINILGISLSLQIIWLYGPDLRYWTPNSIFPEPRSMMWWRTPLRLRVVALRDSHRLRARAELQCISFERQPLFSNIVL